MANVPFAWRQTHSNISSLTVSTRRRCINGKPGSMASKPYCTTKADIGTARHGGRKTQERKYSHLYARHTYKLFNWRGLWPQIIRDSLQERLPCTATGRRWAKDNNRKILTKAVQLFGKLSFATHQELNGIRYRVTQQLTVWLNQLPESDTQHIPRITCTQSKTPQQVGDPHGGGETAS